MLLNTTVAGRVALPRSSHGNRGGTLVGQRVTSVSVSHIIKLLRDPTAGNTPKAHNSFARGAGFPGHREALEHEI